MNISEEILNDELYKSQIEKISDQKLKYLAEDPIRALKVARKGIMKEEPEKANDLEYIQIMADAMQSFAKALLEKRDKRKKGNSSR